MKITAVRTHVAPMAGSWLNQSLIANPLSGFAEYRERRSSWFGKMTAAVVEIETDAGHTGLGFAGGAKGAVIRTIVDEHFAGLLLGRNPQEIERLWETLYRASVMYGRRGLAIEAISAIDIALWDIAGKAVGLPVHALLGGATKDRLPAYVTGNMTGRHLEEGFRDVKIALPYSPAGGEDGLRANEALVRATREQIGPDGRIMLDCYMSLTVPYALELLRRIRDYRIYWLEEPLMPDDLDGYRRLRGQAGTMITGGEHEYTRYGFREIIEKQAVDILQPDIYRAGGISELRKIAAMASAAGLPVIPHGVGAPTYHFVWSNPGSPMVEFVDIFAQGGELLLEGEPIPRGGYVELGPEPGFGYRLNERALRGEVAVAPIW